MTAKIFILSLMILFLGPFHTYAQEIDIHGENAIESSTLVDRLGLFNNQRRYHHGQKGAERHFT